MHNTTLTFPLVEKVSSPQLKMLKVYTPIIMFTGLILGFIFIMIDDEKKVNNTLTQIFTSFSLGCILYMIFGHMAIRKFNKKGKFILTNQSIIISKINRIEYKLNEIYGIRIWFSSFEGEGNSSLGWDSLISGDGNNNFLEFVFGEEKHRYEFYMGAESWYTMLKRKVEELQQENIDIKLLNN
jgi:hypothetical protein